MTDDAGAARMERLWRTSHISGGNAHYVEELFEAYLDDPNSVGEEWRSYFDALPRVSDGLQSDISHATIRNHFLLVAKNQSRVKQVPAREVELNYERKQLAVGDLINSYRRRGHLKATLDPLGLNARPEVPSLALRHHGLSEADLDTEFETATLVTGKQRATLREIITVLEQTYCGTLGAEYMHIVDEAEQRWVQQRLESVRSAPVTSAGIRRRSLDRLIAAEGLEKYLGRRYPGTKRFGLEGAESFIPLLAELIHRAGAAGVLEVVIGMAHRGRLNVLVNLMGKKVSELFDEFEGRYVPGQGSGDVKYHQGFSSNLMTPGGEMHLALCFNPSHLEIAAPVVEGSVRARQDRREDPSGKVVLPISVHGDAAFAGQGVVMETFQMSQTRGFGTGGTVHIIIDNQIGYTISNPTDARSTEYCTEIAKMVQAPILHVNGDDPDSVLFAAQVALDYRMQFRKDVVVDLVCYRRRGHNEGDEPAITQPVMYKRIREHPTTTTIYGDKLVAEGAIDGAEVTRRKEEYRAALDSGTAVAWDYVRNPNESLFVDWRPYMDHDWDVSCDTTLDRKVFRAVADELSASPPGFVLHKQVAKIIEDRHRMAAGAMPINWGFAELVAYGALLHEGFGIRMTGQDICRGTFSHRHAVLHDQRTGATHTPLSGLTTAKAGFWIYDSLLSEEAVLAFEYGYAQTSPGCLVIWEAQFGDFANGAQVVIDQFIASGEHKWGRLCGLVMLLPHGYEGAGPEHSSARLERYLQLCAEHNIHVCVPTTPAQMFHLLRRQVVRLMRRPLIVMTPKSLLRHKEAVSSIEDLCEGRFLNVLPEARALAADRVERVVLCSGKVYYELVARRDRDGLEQAAIIRIEQLYPFPEAELDATLRVYPNVKTVVWCQEEPMNQGAWYSSQHHMRHVLARIDSRLFLHFSGRPASAAAAAGYMSAHVEQQDELVRSALYD